jgi:hypothetical protein
MTRMRSLLLSLTFAPSLPRFNPDSACSHPPFLFLGPFPSPTCLPALRAYEDSAPPTLRRLIPGHGFFLSLPYSFPVPPGSSSQTPDSPCYLVRTPAQSSPGPPPPSERRPPHLCLPTCHRPDPPRTSGPPITTSRTGSHRLSSPGCVGHSLPRPLLVPPLPPAPLLLAHPLP